MKDRVKSIILKIKKAVFEKEVAEKKVEGLEDEASKLSQDAEVLQGAIEALRLELAASTSLKLSDIETKRLVSELLRRIFRKRR